MECKILHIGPSDFSSHRKEIVEFGSDLKINISFLQVNTIEEAYEHLFGGSVGMIFIDEMIDGALEAIATIKAEEMVRHIFIVVHMATNSVSARKEFLLTGADQVITDEDIKNDLFFPLLRPFILNVALMSEKIRKAATLQDKAINDFIMLDLIKAYVPRTIWNVAQECAHLQKIKLPEEEREQTICFGDIKGFTQMAQHLMPKDLIGMLNEVFDVVTKHIYALGGDVDKFIGDAFLGIFDSPSNAVRAMILIQKDLEKLSQKKQKANLPVFQFRIAIHTGPVIRGNVGGNNRYDNTLIGDVVNTTSRLEHIGVAGGVVISDETRKKVGLKIPSQYEASEQLRGRDCEIKYFCVYDYLKDKEEFLKTGKIPK